MVAASADSEDDNRTESSLQIWLKKYLHSE